MDENTSEDDVSTNRRRLLKSVGVAGGIAITGGFSSGVAAASVDRITGDDLVGLARDALDRDDVSNVMPDRIRRTVSAGQAVEVGANGRSNAVLTLGSTDDAAANGTDLADDDVLVSAATSTLENGNEMTAVAYVTGDGRAVSFYDYARPQDGVSTKAERWLATEEAGKTMVSLEDASYNGEPFRWLSDEELATQEDPCGGCDCQGPGDTDPGYELKNVCKGGSALECALATASCVACVGCSGTGACLACVLTSCSGALLTCCGEHGEGCRMCSCWSG